MQHGAANVGGWAVRLVAQYVTLFSAWKAGSRVVLSQEGTPILIS